MFSHVVKSNDMRVPYSTSLRTRGKDHYDYGSRCGPCSEKALNIYNKEELPLLCEQTSFSGDGGCPLSE